MLHKGLQYMDIETHLDEVLPTLRPSQTKQMSASRIVLTINCFQDGVEIECDVPMTLLGPHRCEISKKGHKRADSVSSALTAGFKRERKEEKKAQKDREKRARKENTQSPSAGQSLVNGQDNTTNGNSYKDEGDDGEILEPHHVSVENFSFLQADTPFFIATSCHGRCRSANRQCYRDFTE